MNSTFIKTSFKNISHEMMHHLKSIKMDINFEYVIDKIKELLYKKFSENLKGFKITTSEYLIDNFIIRKSEIIKDEKNIEIRFVSQTS